MITEATSEVNCAYAKVELTSKTEIENRKIIATNETFFIIYGKLNVLKALVKLVI